MKKVNIPTGSGVYIFRNKANRIIYIGKALNLRKRVASYFSASKLNVILNKAKRSEESLPMRSFDSAPTMVGATLRMTTEIVKIEWKETDSEIEALILESQLIKKHKPKYNILMRDDKNYFFVGITRDKFPRIFITHQPIAIAQNQKLTFESRASGRGKIKNKKYISKIKIDYIGPFTDGGALKSTLKYLRTVFPYCTCRRSHRGKCLNTHLGRCVDYCCRRSEKRNNFSTRPAKGGARSKNKHVIVRVSERSERIENLNTKQLQKEYKKNINSIIKILKGQKKSLIKNLEKEMKTEAKKQNFEGAKELKDKIRGLEKIFAHKHVLNAGERGFVTDERGIEKALKKLIGVKTPIKRIEAYDVSNIQGKAATASMVVFTNERPDKSEYRKFKIRLTSRPNDVAMIREVMRRRLRHTYNQQLTTNNKQRPWPKPDLILIDGGKPQLNAALKEIRKAKIDIPVIALAKKKEEIYTTKKLKPIILPKNSPLLHLFQHLRDEAHRFAKKYHHVLRKKSLIENR